MIKIKNLTVKNFMSVGNQTQAVDFTKENLTLVLGENLDQGGDDSGSRNGTGKTTILKSMIIQDIKNGHGCCFMDPHGSDIQDILANFTKITR